jgi:class 3 adenylate cyclase
MLGLPDVSLITSWHVGVPRTDHHLPSPPHGIVQALQAGIGLLDLYFLNHTDIPWYMHCCRTSRKSWPSHAADCPLCFAACLEEADITAIAEALLDLLVGSHYTGRLVGPRPRITALATFFPGISDDDLHHRTQSILAVQNALFLATKLGCRHVEIVGGAAFAESDGGQAADARGREREAEQARTRRRANLCGSLTEVYGNPRGASLLPSHQSRPPFVCLEVEPGGAFLVNNVESFCAIRHDLAGYPNLTHQVLLNVDLAHMFLADSNESELSHAGENQLRAIREHCMDCVGHFHLSDHARTHASDLCPGSYHFFNPDYHPWLELACELMDKPHFSRVIGVEMEACADIHDAQRAMGRTRSWLKSLIPRSSSPSYTRVEGVIMAVDVVGSTACLAVGGVNLTEGAKRLDASISAICRAIQRYRGSVYSFTGDGVVAIFDVRHFSSEQECAMVALQAANSLFVAMRTSVGEASQWGTAESKQLAIRSALHWGESILPAAGALANQLLGADVIIACRLMNIVDHTTPLPDSPSVSHRSNLACSERIHGLLSDAGSWSQVKDLDLKGIHFQVIRERVKSVYVTRDDPF